MKRAKNRKRPARKAKGKHGGEQLKSHADVKNACTAKLPPDTIKLLDGLSLKERAQVANELEETVLSIRQTLSWFPGDHEGNALLHPELVKKSHPHWN